MEGLLPALGPLKLFCLVGKTPGLTHPDERSVESEGWNEVSERDAVGRWRWVGGICFWGSGVGVDVVEA